MVGFLVVNLRKNRLWLGPHRPHQLGNHMRRKNRSLPSLERPRGVGHPQVRTRLKGAATQSPLQNVSNGLPPACLISEFRLKQLMHQDVCDFKCFDIQSASNISRGALVLITRSEEHTSELQSRQYLVC